jgi:hypothetical protein
MKYETPSVVEVGSAIDAVQNSLAKVAGPVEVTDLMTVPAYQSDE